MPVCNLQGLGRNALNERSPLGRGGPVSGLPHEQAYSSLVAVNGK